jgi:hypothetical protein
MVDRAALLTSHQMASFVAKGYLRFDGLVPDDINRQFIEDAGELADERGPREAYAKLMATSRIPAVPAGTTLEHAYAQGSAIARLLELPQVAGTIESLVGPGCLFDHHFLHVTFPDTYFAEAPQGHVSQHTHQDSTIDPRDAFDVQIMYFPHTVTREMGGTRFVPGTHLRKVSEAAIARYQNIRGQMHVICPAGTVLFMHHGIWHGGGLNRSSGVRYMFKIRLNPMVRQRRLWNTDDLTEADFAQRPIFFRKAPEDTDHIHAILTRPEPWFENDTGRLEYINRIKLWRFLLGDDSFDADYWLTRVENAPDEDRGG